MRIITRSQERPKTTQILKHYLSTACPLYMLMDLKLGEFDVVFADGIDNSQT